MIVDLLFAFFDVLVSVAKAFLPTWSPFDLDPALDAVDNVAGPVFKLMSWANWYMPVDDILVIGALGGPLYIAAVIYRAAIKSGRLVHLFGGR